MECKFDGLIPVMQRLKYVIIFLICGGSLGSSCLFSTKRERSIKDFDQHMLDLRIYHENLGDALLSRNKDYAEWFVNDMDSIFRQMAEEFTTHRKLKRPFEYHYKKSMKPYLHDLEKEIEKNDWKNAISTYSLLTKKCNDCHIDHDIDKEVRDMTKQ